MDSESNDKVKHDAERRQGISRRAFLQSAGVAAMAAGVGNVVTFAGQGGKVGRKFHKVVVGAHPWVYAATLPNYDITPVLPQIFADMSYAGVDAIELMDTALRPADAVERIGELSQKNHLPVLGTSFSAPMWKREEQAKSLEGAELAITRLHKLGGRTLGTSVGSSPTKKTPEQLDAQAECLRKVMAICQANGVVLNLHNHTYELKDEEWDLKGTLARIPDVKLGPDLNWVLRAGIDPVDFIRRYGDRIIFLHLRDQNADGTWSEAMGEGAMDYAAISRELRKINFSGDAVIELAHEKNFKPTRPLRESLRMSRAYVRKTLGY